ncbi:unnamed protein product [Effrenium voratum]|uniref:Uncharacterized protein n=1 Tax=Effrenium voratum TaxID=2562239 RepID=A0AA36IA77_9DINO|nr:unnamed protein product [Effrenium voratum]
MALRFLVVVLCATVSAAVRSDQTQNLQLQVEVLKAEMAQMKNRLDALETENAEARPKTCCTYWDNGNSAASNLKYCKTDVKVCSDLGGDKKLREFSTNGYALADCPSSNICAAIN